MGLGWKSACKEGKYTLQGLASTITLRGQIDGIYAALASGTQSIASTKTQINCKTCRVPSAFAHLILPAQKHPRLCPQMVVCIRPCPGLSLSNTDPAARAYIAEIKC